MDINQKLRDIIDVADGEVTHLQSKVDKTQAVLDAQELLLKQAVTHLIALEELWGTMQDN